MVANGTFMVLADNTKDIELTKNNIQRKMAWIRAAWSGSCGLRKTTEGKGDSHFLSDLLSTNSASVRNGT